jgi:hypothetical protein
MLDKQFPSARLKISWERSVSTDSESHETTHLKYQYQKRVNGQLGESQNGETKKNREKLFRQSNFRVVFSKKQFRQFKNSKI